MQSRNQREGRYVGKYKGHHKRHIALAKADGVWSEAAYAAHWVRLQRRLDPTVLVSSLFNPVLMPTHQPP